MIPLTCDHCNKNLRLRDELAGRRIKCPGCGGTLTVPSLDDQGDDAPPPKKKEPTFTPVKPARARPIDDDDEDDDEGDNDKRKTKGPKKAGKPSPIFLILGLILGLGGLVAMSACIVFAKQAYDSTSDKRDQLDKHQKDLAQAVNDVQKDWLNKDIAKLEIEIEEIQRSEVMRYIMFAVLCGIVFLVGFGIRGYYHVAMKRWHADAHGTSKKRKRRDEDDDDDDDQ